MESLQRNSFFARSIVAIIHRHSDARNPNDALVAHEAHDVRTGENADDASVISSDAGNVTVRVLRTDEELMIAKSVIRVLNLEHGKLAS